MTAALSIPIFALKFKLPWQGPNFHSVTLKQVDPFKLLQQEQSTTFVSKKRGLCSKLQVSSLFVAIPLNDPTMGFLLLSQGGTREQPWMGDFAQSATSPGLKDFAQNWNKKKTMENIDHAPHVKNARGMEKEIDVFL
jgi:hypothetical protein